MTLNELEKYTKMAITAAENEDIYGITEIANLYTAELTKTFPMRWKL